MAPESSKTVVTLTDAVAASLREACSKQPCFEDSIAAARRAIQTGVEQGYDLDAMWLESDADKRLPGKYRRHQVVSDPDYGFTVVVLLWEPGACTPIHDHDTWCVFACLQGEMEVTNYAVIEDDGQSNIKLAEVGREHAQAFSIGDNAGKDTEVHRVRNVGETRAVSLHVYGADLTKRTLFDGRGIQVEGKTGCMAFQSKEPVY